MKRGSKPASVNVAAGRLQQRRAKDHRPRMVTPVVTEVLPSPGEKLNTGTRAFFEPRFGHDFSQIAVSAVATEPETKQSYLVGGLLPEDPHENAMSIRCHSCPARVQTKRAVNQPGDVCEQEADRVAEEVIHGGDAGTRTWQTPDATVMRQTAEKSGTEKEKEKYKDAAKKVGEAFLKTDLGRKLIEQAKEKGGEFVTSLPGMVITGIAAAGTVGALAATNKELPIGVPEIPLDKLHPGLKMKITYEGPVLSPTKAMIAFSGTFGGLKEEKKPGMTKSEMERAKTAKMAAEIAAFQEMLKTPEQKKAEKEALTKLISEKYGPKLPSLPEGMSAHTPTMPSLTLTLPSLEYKKKSYQLLEEELKLDVPGVEIKPEEEAEKKKKDDEKSLQRKAGSAATDDSVVKDVPPIVDEVLRSPGQPLEPATRTFMESRFGHDFCQVRVHTDSKAAESAQAVNALAYTVGRDVVFGAGQYQPTSSVGQKLSAHELTHIVQQRDAESLVANKSIIENGDASRPYERGAEKKASPIDNNTESDKHLLAHELAHVVQQFHGGANADAEERASAAADSVVKGGSVQPDRVGGAPIGIQTAGEAEGKAAGTRPLERSGISSGTRIDRFVRNRAALTTEQLAKIDTVAWQIALHLGILTTGIASVKITGHTDTTRTESYNTGLGLERAQTAKVALLAALKKQQVSRESLSDITVESKGDHDLVVPTKDNVDEPRNRRVEIEVTIVSQPAPQVPAKEPILLQVPILTPPVGPMTPFNVPNIPPQSREWLKNALEADPLLKKLPDWARNKAIDALKDADEPAADKMIDALPLDDKEKAAVKAAIKALLRTLKGKKFKIPEAPPRGLEREPMSDFPKLPGEKIFKLPPIRF